MNKKFLSFSLALLASSLNIQGMSKAKIQGDLKQIEAFVKSDPVQWQPQELARIEGLLSGLEAKKLEKTATQKYREMLELNKQRVAQIGGVQDELAQTQADLQRAENEWTIWQQEARAKEAARNDLANALEKQGAEFNAARQQLDQQVQAYVAGSEAQRGALEAELQRQKAQFDSVITQYQMSERDLLDRNAQLYSDADAQLKAQQAAIDQYQRQIESLSKSAANQGEKKALEDSVRKLKVSNDELKRERTRLAKQLSDAEAKAKADAQQQAAARERVNSALAQRKKTAATATGSGTAAASAGSGSAAAPAGSAGAKKDDTGKATAANASFSEMTDKLTHIYQNAIRILDLPQDTAAQQKIYVDETNTLYHQLTLDFKNDAAIKQMHLQLERMAENSDSIDNQATTSSVLVGQIKDFAANILRKAPARSYSAAKPAASSQPAAAAPQPASSKSGSEAASQQSDEKAKLKKEARDLANSIAKKIQLKTNSKEIIDDTNSLIKQLPAELRANTDIAGRISMIELLPKDSEKLLYINPFLQKIIELTQ